MDPIERFATELRLTGKSVHTIRAYTSDVRGVLDAVGKANGPITAEDIRDYLRRRMDNGIAPASLNRTIVALREYFTYLEDHGALAANPMLRIKKMKTPQRLPKALTRDQVTAIFTAIPASAPRDRALIGLAYHTGLRVEELVTLTVEDVDTKRGRVTVQHGKGGKGRTVPLNQIVKRYLNAYLKVRPDEETPALFVSRHHRGLSVSSAQKVFKRYAQNAKVKASIHALRHSVATHMLDKGAPLAWIQDFLGHASITSTVIYSKLTDKRREAVFDQLELAGAFVG